MSESVEQLQSEIEKLRDKNAQLINEKRKIRDERDSLQEQLQTITTERDAAQAEVKRITIDLPRAEVLEAVAVDGMSEVLRRELEHHFDIVRTDDGKDVFHKDGQPVEVEGKGVEFSADGIRVLYEKAGLKIGAMLKGSGATGGGAMGTVIGVRSTESKKTQPQNAHFGLK
ncbi:hypothetical protein [Marinobacter sp.]|uniref:hypothetical protein n=1 Tax=Marinobacter sp. TaxID=50741 RepID=UPI001A0C6ED9|nr:hypothetical protein [Marinobacter sp.]MBE0487380.1 hypothetical protein [Marinobacter sp.]